MPTLSTILLAASLITNVADLANANVPGMRYRVEGVVTSSGKRFGSGIAIEDDDRNAVIVANETVNPFHNVSPGDVIRASGRTAIGSTGLIRRNCTHIDAIGRRATPPPTATSVKALADGKMDYRFVRVEATLRDVFPDEIDPTTIYFVLQDGSDTVTSFRSYDKDMAARLHSMVGARLEVTGTCSYNSGGRRTCLGRVLKIESADSLKILVPPPKDDFDVPGIDELGRQDPSRIAQAGRCRTIGTVIATWGRNKLLIKDNWSRLTEVELADQELPPCGIMAEVMGLPASNFFRINLLRAKWRKALGPPMKSAMAEDIKVKSLFVDEKNRFRYDSSWYGHVVRILESDSFMIPVDATPAPETLEKVKIGFGVEVSGVCIMDGANWSPYSAFPQITGMTLVVRSPDDIHVISRPSWWTPRRLLTVLGIVLAILGGIAFWNVLLHRAVRRREKELKREIFAHVNSDMKMRERNNLSIELHDSISQGLTGVSLEIDSARRLAGDPAEMDRHLDLAAKTLKSCRNELRTCIYDLRNNTLGDRDMNESIRRTLSQFAERAKLSIRFTVPRERMSDNVVHNILRIIGELAANAVNHGHASSVKVAGSIEDSTISFSVRDDGCGFDPERCPGAGQGHFGIQGIRERLKRLNGKLVFESSCGGGTKAIVTLELPEEDCLEDT